MSKTLHKPRNNFRVIAGKWRGRRLSLQPNAELRPTPDRVRETVFNWFGQHITQARCLDLFAGSGALGFEALSRGAGYCDFVELDKGAARQIRVNLQLLNVSAEQAEVSTKPAIDFLKKEANNHYDIIFLDPPFHQNMIQKLLPPLEAIVQTGTYLYIEIEKNSALPELPEHWSLIREKTAGQVRYHLVLVEE